MCCVFSVYYIWCNILSSSPILMVTVGTSNERDRLPVRERAELPVRDGRQRSGGRVEYTGGDQEGPRQGEGAEGDEGSPGRVPDLVTTGEIDLASLKRFLSAESASCQQRRPEANRLRRRRDLSQIAPPGPRDRDLVRGKSLQRSDIVCEWVGVCVVT